MYIGYIIFHFLFTIILLLLCKKFNILIDNKTEAHKKYSSQSKSLLVGGIFIIIFLNYYYFFVTKNPALCIFFSLVFLIGLMSDLKTINSASLRFLMQFFIIVCFVNYLNLEINSTKISFFDELLQNSLVNIFFVSFCLLVLINGSNFIDGINCNVSIYFLIVLLSIILFFDNFVVNRELLINFIFILLIIIILNALGILYLGDSGSYTLSLFVGFFLINFSQINNTVSPYLFVVLLWYPCFELLFSMIRRSLKKIKTYEPDTSHLHHLIYKKLKIYYKIKNNLILHLLTVFIINFYNMFIFFVSKKYIYFSEILVLMIIINITVYIACYSFLKN